MTASLCCLGSALVDHEFTISDEQLKQLDATKGLMTLINEEEFNHYTKLLASFGQPLRFGGGSAVNSLVAYRNFGGEGAFYGAVGDDDSGNFFTDELQSIGIRTYCSISPNQPTGHCLVLITPEGERTMLTYLGANSRISPNNDAVKSFHHHDYLYAESYLLATEGPCQTLLHYFRLARQQAVKIALSLSDVSITRSCTAQIEEALADGVDMLFGNRDELSDYTGKQDLEDIFNALNGKVSTLVMTEGKKGSWICNKEGKIHIAAAAVETKDTLGAGDAYAGAFLYAMQRYHGNYERVGNFSAYAAGQVVSRFGPRLTINECQSIKSKFSL